jgi:hypothetical protein
MSNASGAGCLKRSVGPGPAYESHDHCGWCSAGGRWLRSPGTDVLADGYAGGNGVHYQRGAGAAPCSKRHRPFRGYCREVGSPGLYPWREGMTLTDAIEVAGGLTQFAGNKVRVTHLDGTTAIYRYNKITRHSENDPLLSVGDRIWITGGMQ